MLDDEELKDWEMEDEKPPEKLRHKWDQEDLRGRKAIECSRCKKHVPEDSLTCIFCGAEVFRDSGFLRRLLKWITGR